MGRYDRHHCWLGSNLCPNDLAAFIPGVDAARRRPGMDKLQNYSRQSVLRRRDAYQSDHDGGRPRRDEQEIR